MKIRSYHALILLVAFTQACRKDPKPKPQPAPDPAPVTGTVAIGGKTYPTLKFGNRTWTIENHNGNGGVAYTDPAPKPEYGKYYTYQEIQAIDLPAGWRIPSYDDYIALGESQGVVFQNSNAINQDAIKKLTSKTNWRNVAGNNLSGFNAHPAGYIFDNSKPMDGDIGEFWTSNGLTFSIQEAGPQALRLTFYADSNKPEYRFNVRFVKDN